MQPQQFLDRGIPVIPLAPRSKNPVVPWLEYQKRLPTDAEVKAWFNPLRRYNLAVVCGPQGLVILDLDDMQRYRNWRLWALDHSTASREVAQRTLTDQTARGMHVYVICTQAVRGGKVDGGDLKGVGSYCAIPPSIHPSGYAYHWIDPTAPIVTIDDVADLVPDPPAPPPIRQHAGPATARSGQTFGGSTFWPETMIDRIKRVLSPVDLLGLVRPGRTQRWVMALCPLHQDRNHSMSVDLDWKVCRCFAGCNGGKAMDVITLYCLMHNCDAKTAVHALSGLL